MGLGNHRQRLPFDKAYVPIPQRRTWRMSSSSPPRRSHKYQAQLDGKEVCRLGRTVSAGRRGLCEQPLSAASPIASPSSCALRWPPILCSVDRCQHGHSPAVNKIKPYPLNDLLDSFLMTLHFQECLDLRQGQVLPVTQCHQLIECTQQLKGITEDLPLVKALADAGGDLGKQVQTVNVLKNVGLAVGDQDDIQLIQWLVHEAHVVLLDGGVLGSGICQFGERGKQRLNARSGDFTKLAREDRLASASTYRRCEDDLGVGGQSVSGLTSWNAGKTSQYHDERRFRP